MLPAELNPCVTHSDAIFMWALAAMGAWDPEMRPETGRSEDDVAPQNADVRQTKRRCTAVNRRAVALDSVAEDFAKYLERK